MVWKFLVSSLLLFIYRSHVYALDLQPITDNNTINLQSNTNIDNNTIDLQPNINEDNNVFNLQPNSDEDDNQISLQPTSNVDDNVTNLLPSSNVDDEAPNFPQNSNVDNIPPVLQLSINTDKVPNLQIGTNVDDDVPNLQPNSDIGNGVPDLQPNLDANVTNNCDCDCDCVPYFLCRNGSINTNGEGIINIRQNGPCNDYMKVCCKKGDQSVEPLTTTPAPIEPPKGCGYRHPRGISFTITGDKNNEAQYAEFPWMVSVTPDNGAPDVNSFPFCGGALIHPQAVITAAHCVNSKNDIYIIRAGEWDILHSNEPYPHQDVRVKSVTIRSDFYSGALFNDIAFLYLEKPVEMTENIGIICLPPKDFYTDAGRCYTTGWGKDTQGRVLAILKKIDVPQVPKDSCQKLLRKTRLGERFILHRSFVCAGGEKRKDACKGDGGSPLVCPIEGQENRYYQNGIVAWGIGCGEENVPGVYVDVAFFRDWIDQQMGEKGLNASTYQY